MELRIPSSGPAAGSIFAPSRFHSAPLSIVGVLSVKEYGRLDAVEDIQLAEYASQGLKLDIPPSPTRIAREAPPAPPAEPTPIIPDMPTAVTYIERPDPESELPKFAILAADQEIF